MIGKEYHGHTQYNRSIAVCLACTAVYGFMTVDRPGVQAAAQASSKPHKSK